MKKNCLKTCILIIIILFLGEAIAPSMSCITLPSQRDFTPEFETTTIKNDLDPKIEAAIQMVNESLLKEILTVLAVEIGPRFTQTYGSEEAAKYIYKQFTKMGLETRYHYWESFNDRLPLRYYKDKNIVATLKGKDNTCDEIIVFNAHYDTIRSSPGAIDDGSGVAAVLTAAYALSQIKFNRTIKFIAFSGEEIGLLGSRNYVRDLYKNDTEILVEFNADMIGYANTSEEGRIVYVSSSEDAKWIVDEIKVVNENYDINFNIKRAWNISAEGTRHGGDYFDFVLHGYEAVAFWQSGRYEHWHKPTDTIEKVNFSYLTNVTRLIVASLAHMADIKVYYPQVIIGAPKRGRLYFEDRTLKKYKYERTVVIDDFLICANDKTGDVPIEKVEFIYDGKLIYTDMEMPYQWRLNKRSLRKHTVEVVIHDKLGRTARDQVTFRLINIFIKK